MKGRSIGLHGDPSQVRLRNEAVPCVEMYATSSTYNVTRVIATGWLTADGLERASQQSAALPLMKKRARLLQSQRETEQAEWVGGFYNGSNLTPPRSLGGLEGEAMGASTVIPSTA